MTRKEEVFEIIKANNGITLREIADKMNVLVQNKLLPEIHLLHYEGKISYITRYNELTPEEIIKGKKNAIDFERVYYEKK